MWITKNLDSQVQKLPAKTSLLFTLPKSSHSLSHTTLTMKSHIKYRVHKIEHNYSKIWHDGDGDDDDDALDDDDGDANSTNETST